MAARSSSVGVHISSAFIALFAGGILCSNAVAAADTSAIGFEWTRFDAPTTSIVGADGKEHTATCSGFPGTDPKFSFWARRGTTDDLVVFFDGGGACWDSFTCSFPIGNGIPNAPQLFVSQIIPGTSPANYSGVFDSSNAANPVRDWNFVYIPYCTGDAHLGSTSKQYSPVPGGNPRLTVPFTIQHRGFDNFMVVLDFITKTFGNPKKILVAGSSAGAYGAMGNFGWIQEAFPQAHAYAIGDAGQGVDTATWEASNPGRGSWNIQLPPWIFGVDAKVISSADLARIDADHYRHRKFSQFTTRADATQTAFYNLQKTFYPPGGACANVVVDWNNRMLEDLSDTEEEGNFRAYVADGSYHTIMRSPVFYSESSPGIVYSAWLDGMLRSQGGTGGNGGLPWTNVACPTCLVPLPCQ